MDIRNSILIAGGYGVVGRQIATLIRDHHPDLPLVIAGRNLKKAEALAQELGNASGLQLDVEQPKPLQENTPRAVIAVVNDSYDYLLMDAVSKEIPYLDVTRWPERLRQSIDALDEQSLRSPVMFASGWMGGVASVIAVAASQAIATIDSIDISVLFSLKDKAGPNSVEYMDRLATPFETMIAGRTTKVFPYTDPLKVKFPDGYQTAVYRFDTPDQMTLPQTTGAKTVAARIAFDDIFSTQLLRVLIRSGIWRLISGDRFTSLRRSLLYNPGSGASHQIRIDVKGKDAQDLPQKVTATIVDPKGQTHLTALGALIQLERLLGLDGMKPPIPGIIYPDTAPQIKNALQILQEFGVIVTGISEKMFEKIPMTLQEKLPLKILSLSH
ncbi:Saccharopine dehydrogenase [[Leptolyngbya] sp. PCC 7376]|uniref:saccharopine dehydrogenase family protein n=1 Tax=[Leptolyngbya] sp. PCC 7376 TaxID=111781 RepID=UPI00029F1863|nr:saccharopine dehydrogenase [[Leptolyngbya] sp. PCC 7376]AFY37825.1 Saccharopine dehydrogenase [[Leptolyngbya] sp. PCC 7376]